MDAMQEKYILEFMGQFDTDDLEEIVYDSVSPGVCLQCGAESASVEPDCDSGYCENCGSNKVISAVELVLQGYA
jgi:hypothetical protein